MNFRLRHLLSLTLVSLQTMIPLVGAASYGPHPYWDADNNVYDLGGIPLRINSGAIIGSGNLGIGVLNPGYRVDVDGYINSSSGICINGSCITSWDDVDNAWKLTGNSGTTAGINFIGTIDNQDIVFKRANIIAGILTTTNSAWGVTALANNTSGSRNTANGYRAMFSNIEGAFNTAVGDGALYSNISGGNHTSLGVFSSFLIVATGGTQPNTSIGYGALHGGDFATPSNNTAYSNIAIGYQAMYGTDGDPSTGYENVSIGNGSMRYNAGGYQNVAVGVNSLSGNTYGQSNTAVGFESMYNNGNGYGNVAMGKSSLYLNMHGNENVAIGLSALYNTDTSQNTAVGYQSLYSNQSISNTAVGWNALYANTTGYANSAIGWNVMSHNIDGVHNVAFGENALSFNENGNYNTAIGNAALGKNISGSYNLGLGYMADVSTGGLDNAIAIGYRSYVTASNTMVLGGISGVNGATSDTQVVIGDTEAGTGNLGEHYALDVQNGYINSSNGLCIDGDCITGWAGFGGGSLPNATSTGNTLRWTGTGWADSNSTDLLVNGITIGKGVNSLDNNTVLGREALASNPGDWNTAIGTYALRSSLQNWNTAVGYAALYQNTYGYENTAIGHSSLVNNTTGIGNVSLGLFTLGMNQVGGGNVAIGNMALGYQENGNNNVALGGVALLNNGSGSNNLGIGYKADVGISDLINASAIGPYAYVSASNTMVLGSVNGLNGATADTQVVIGSDSAGVGNNSEIYRLDVQNGYINSSAGFCMNGDCKSSWSQVASSRYPGCSRDDIQLANGQIWAGCDVYNGGYYLYQHGEMTAWNFSSGTTAQNNAITLAGITYRSSSIGTVGYSGWSSVVADTRSGTYDKTWYGTPGDDTGPCAHGYHVPSNLNWNNAYTELGSDRNTFVNTLFLTSDYYRSAGDGSIISDGFSYYWSSTISGSNNAIATIFDGTTVNTYSFQDRANAYKIRCLKDNTDIAE